MISETLTFLSKEINKFLNQKLGATTDARLVLGNIARVGDGDTGTNSLANKIVLSLINVEEDKVAKIRENFTRADSSVIYKNPPLLVNLYILIAANMNVYSDNLKMVTYIMQFFQAFNHFTPATHPGLDMRITQINADLFTLNFEQINHLWSTLGGKYLPSVMYKIRQISVEDDHPLETEGKLIETIIMEAGHVSK
jgi:hypothetical protein